MHLELREAHLLRIISYRVGNRYGIIQTGNSHTSFIFQGEEMLAKGEHLAQGH